MTVDLDDERRRIKQFLASVDEYDDLEDVFPLPGGSIGGDEPDDDRRAARWVTTLHAVVLREYFLSDKTGSRERLRLPAVARAVRVCSSGVTGTDAEWDDMIANVGVAPTLMDYGREGVPTRSDTEVMLDHLYGRILHGDAGRWPLTDPPGASFDEFAITVAAQNHAVAVRQFALWIRALVDSGNLVLPS